MIETLIPPALSDHGLRWHHSFGRLGTAYYTELSPTPLPEPYWVGSSVQVGELLNLSAGWNTSAQWLDALTGNLPLAGGKSLATVYSGHQFGVWAGQLGDGRAILLGESGGLEIQLKGAGLTPYSRMGDGRAVLRSSIREFLCSEAMHGLGIPSSRALCVTGSDAPVRRETLETAAVVTRVAPSFIRFGHFEHFAHTDQHEELKTLADYVIDKFYPQCRETSQWQGNPYVGMLAEVTRRTAQMVARWQSVGFCHGVMNTDNMSILGLTIDYGPFQFLDAFDPANICNHSDRQGRYAYYKQPNVAYWNLFCLGQALLPLIGDQEQAIAALETFKELYPQAFAQQMAAKLGFAKPHEAHQPLIEDILKLLAADRVDYTIFWRCLSHWAERCDSSNASVRDLFMNRASIDDWLEAFNAQTRNGDTPHDAGLMLRSNPKYVLRNHLGELAIRAARQKDFSKVAELLKVLERPYDEHPASEHLADFPPDWAGGIEISCSS
jgi:uncharacterized protein YdiU (UPF0061 family)